MHRLGPTVCRAMPDKAVCVGGGGGGEDATLLVMLQCDPFVDIYKT